VAVPIVDPKKMMAEKSLLPALLSHEAPPNLPEPDKRMAWVALDYKFTDKFIPPDLLPQFIARTYHYTTQTHWRDGVALKVGNQHAQAEWHLHTKTLHLMAWGTQPQNFFETLRDTIEPLLPKNLQLERTVPCQCSVQPCSRRYKLETLQKRFQQGKSVIECDESTEDVEIRLLLTGSKTGLLDVHDDLQHLKAGQAVISEQIRAEAELQMRRFTLQWKMQSECPNTFILLPQKGHKFNPQNWFSQPYRLHLLCQHNECPHVVADDEGYDLRQEKIWWQTMRPWLENSWKVLKFAMPLVSHMDFIAEDQLERMNNGFELMQHLADYLPQLEPLPTRDTFMGQQPTELQQQDGALRAFYELLKQIDPSHRWANLTRVATKDGNILWLCPTHAQQYASPKLGGF
jgi:hypothetical protein